MGSGIEMKFNKQELIVMFIDGIICGMIIVCFICMVVLK